MISKKNISKREITLIVMFVIFLSILFSVPSHIRYVVTEIFAETKVSFLEPSLGLLNIDDGEYGLISEPVNGDFHIDLTKTDFKNEYYIFGSYYNSNKIFTVVLNGEKVFNGIPSYDFISNVFSKNYLHKKYKIRLGKIKKNSEVEIIIGKEKFKYNIYLE